jgi:hypothetical protein
MALTKKQSYARRLKGFKFEQRVSRIILNIFHKFLGKGDVKPTPMSNNGEDIILSDRAEKILPVTLECKDHKNRYIGTYDIYEQARKHNPNKEPVGVITDSYNKLPVLAVVDFEHYLKLHEEIQVLKEKKPESEISLNGTIKNNGYFVPIANFQEVVATVTIN